MQLTREVLGSLQHFGERPLRVQNGLIKIVAGRLRLCFRILEDPAPIGFRGTTWVAYDHAEVECD